MASNPSSSEIFEAAQESIAAHDGIDGFLSALVHSGHCARPVRLVGEQVVVDLRTGETHSAFSSNDTSNGVLLKACGSRRASVCPACATVYRADARHLVLAGLAGGKGVDPSIATHPAVFATLTAPSFGAVHHVTTDGVCHAGGTTRMCAHGLPTACDVRHERSDPVVGQPLCVECYHYEEHVVWHALASELWRRTAIYLPRALAKALDLSAAQGRANFGISFVKVVEYQARGAIHVHCAIRADAPDGSPPPADVTPRTLVGAVSSAARRVSVPYPPAINGGNDWARWGGQLDITAIREPNSARQTAAYIAKYTTKSTETSGALDHRLREEDLATLESSGLSDHHQRLVLTAWRLGGRRDLAHLGLRRWAHTFGYRGHWLTKSANYSTTFTALRSARAAHRSQAEPDKTSDNSLVMGQWSFAGVGHTTEADAILAAALYRSLERKRRIAWEGITSLPARDDLRLQPEGNPLRSSGAAAFPEPEQGR